MEALERLDLVLAADVVFDDAQTVHLVRCLAALLQRASERGRCRPGAQHCARVCSLCTCRGSPLAGWCGGHLAHARHRCCSAHSAGALVCVEKRFCYTLDDLDVRAPAYDFFLAELARHRDLVCTRLDLADLPWLLPGRLPDHLELWQLQHARMRDCRQAAGQAS